ncbi:MAG: endonuclease [Alloprevotella sp.]|nr:endonuclease [Alloprevotella sp.]
MKFFKVTLFCVLFAAVQGMFAVPVKPGVSKTLTLTDGTTIVATLVGDEHGHFWRGQDGRAYQVVSGTGRYQAVDEQAVQEHARARRAAANQRRMRRMPKRIGDVGSIAGQKKGLIILVNFTDVSFKDADNNALYQRIANEENFSYGSFKGSMRDYFYAQSEGKFELTFDVVGPVTVSKAQAYYGGNSSNSSGSDKHPAEMVIEALKLVDSQVNFANYDWDGDGEVEQVYVVYAGKGEADGGDEDTIWPHEYDLYSANYYGDGAGRQKLDGVWVNTYACGGELNGSGNIAGIGTMCHEFSHCLGYPDFYDTDYSGGQGMFEWDLMDSGSYNGDGYRPAGYTSYERWVAGWKTPVTLENTQTITNMAALQNGGDSYIIYNKGNNNEYYLLENRQKTGWDASIPGSGLLILHVDYSATAWSNNEPNDEPSHQRMTWIPADNNYQYETYKGTKYYTTSGAANDPFPYGNVNAFGRSTTPAAKFYNKNSDGTYYLDSSVSQITQNSDGTVSFRFVGAGDEEEPDTPSADGKTFVRVASTESLQAGKRYIIACGSKSKAAGDLSGSYLTDLDVTVKDDYITIGDDVAVFVLNGNNSNGWSFKNERTNQYLQCTAVKSVSYTASAYTWTLSNGTAGVIMTAGSNGTMLYNNGSPRFTTYTSSPTASMIQANLYMEYDNGTTPEPLIVADEALAFSTTVGTSQTKALEVLSEGLTEDITVSLTDASHVFSLGSTTISKSLESATVDVTFNPSTAGSFTGKVTLTSAGAETVEVMLSATATDPKADYYRSAGGKKGAALKTAMCGIIYNRTEQTYDGLWKAYQTTDVRSDGKIWDMYSNVTNYDPVNGSHANSAEGSGFNREHSFPKSWFGGEVMPMYTDLHHLYPVDGNINTRRSNNPYGETDGGDWKSENDFSKLGTCTYPGYTGKVFEPADEYKGDFARTYFYMVTCYEEKLHDWYTNYSSTEVTAVLDGNTYPGLSAWQLEMLMKWAKNDPVSEKETARNNAVYAIQNNRNPFIDYPGLEEYIWGFMTNSTFSYDNYQQPVYKQDVTMSFSVATAEATVGADFTEPILTIEPAGFNVSYSSSNTDVATVDESTGEVTLVAAGTTTITATFAGNDGYNGSSASYTLTVRAAQAISSGNYELVTDAATLAAGDKILIAYVNETTAMALGTNQKTNNREAVAVVADSGGRLVPGETAQIVTLEKEGSNYLLNVGNGYLYAASSSSNYLRTETVADANAKATISISGEGNATITFQGTNTRNVIRYNPNTNNSSPLFACYASTATVGSLPQIYREVKEAVYDVALQNAADNAATLSEYDGKLANVTLSGRTLYKDGSWNTLCLPFDVESFAETPLADATVMEMSASSSFTSQTGYLELNFMETQSLTAGKAYVVKWETGEDILEPVFSGVRISRGEPQATTSTDTRVRFVGTYAPATLLANTSSNLYMGADNLLYYPTRDNFRVNAFRAYFLVTLEDGSEVRGQQLNFGSEVTAADASLLTQPASAVYDLQGRRVVTRQGNSPAKGIYIINGRKVLKN